MTDALWVLKNWDLLRARYMLRYKANGLHKFLKDTRLYCSGKFFGDKNFLCINDAYAGVTSKGSDTLLLRPFVSTVMPEGIEAIYIDPSRYKFNDKGYIVDLDSYEYPIFVFER